MPRSEASIKKQSETRKRLFSEGKLKVWNKGLKNSQIGWSKGLTKETNKSVRKISESKLGHKVSVETREKIRKTLKGRSPVNKGKTNIEMYGEKKAKIILKKMIGANKGKKLSSKHKKNISRGCVGRVVTKEGRKNYRLGTIKRIERQYLNGEPLGPSIGKYETSIINYLERKFNYNILRQYNVAGYFLDGYCPALRLAIEIDEPRHLQKEQLKKDIIRQNEIEDVLNCQFLRIPVKNYTAKRLKK